MSITSMSVKSPAAARTLTCTLTRTLTRTLALTLALVAVGIGASSSVQAEPSSRRVRLACNGDAKRLCPREKPDSPEMHYCMEAKGRMLSRTCVRALEDDGIVPRGYFKG